MTGRRRAPWPLMLVAALFIVVPFLAWYGTWFGFYPRVVALAGSPETDLRMTAAWVMGVEHRSEEFRAALRRLLADSEPIVRRNAALALVRFGDAASRPELLAMLRAFEVKASTEGTAMTALSVGTPVKRESLLVRYELKPNMVEEVRSPLPGRVEQAFVKQGDQFRVEDRLFVIGPDAEQVRDALIGLSYVGDESDAAEVERYTQSVEGMHDGVKTQAVQTLAAIKRRAGQRQ
ncbi:MAG: HEAT repeat domain-containing protein [Acidobacteria bacterium]|nr:HEAT repeat domain-containing protein [Acidobacteriota bacterium]